MAACTSTVEMRFQEVGVEHAYTIDVVGGDATYQRIKWAMQNLSKKLSNKKNKFLFRSVLLHSLTTHVRFKGSITIDIDELFEWQEELEADQEIVVTVDTRAEERQTKKQKSTR